MTSDVPAPGGQLTWLANAIAAVSLLLLGTGQAMLYVAVPDQFVSNLIQGAAFVLDFGVVGWLLARRLPANPIGWSLSAAGLVSAVASLGHGLALLALNGYVELGFPARAGAVLDAYVWIVAVPLGASLPLLLLPDGRLLAVQWRAVVWVLFVGSAAGALGSATTPGKIGAPPYQDVTTPFGLAALGPWPQTLAAVGIGVLMAGTAASVVAVACRFRRSRGVERQQLLWVTFGGGVALGGGLITIAAPPGGPVGLVAGIISASALPASIGIAVLRYRLYDLGRVVSRTVSYALMTSIVLGIYLAGVTAAAQLSPGTSSLAVAASTLAAAALFQPLRHRVQTVVDSRFNRARYDADRTVQAFSRTLRDEVNLDAVSADLLHVVRQTVQPQVVGLWLRPPGRWAGSPPRPLTPE